jgi:3'-5' exoribonuclease
VWDYSGPVSPADIGVVVKIRGTVSEFRGMPQMTIERIRLAEDTDQVQTNNLVPTAPIDVEAS